MSLPRPLFPLIALALLLSACGVQHSVTVSTSSKTSASAKPWRTFVDDLTNVADLAKLNKNPLKLVSSWDRTGGNDDFDNFITRRENGAWVVLLDEKGPGVVRRFWTTGIDPGHRYRIFFDGESTPRIDGTIDELFGTRAPFTPPLARYMNLCWSSFIPLTYDKSIRVESQAPPVHPMWGPRKLYSQFSVEQLPAGSEVESFPRQLTPADTEALARAGAAWNACVEPVTTWNAEGMTTHVIAPKSTKTIYEAQGPGIVDSFDLFAEPTDANATVTSRRRVLSDSVLRISYDGSSTASIETPVTDFFVMHGKARTFSGLTFANDTNRWTSRLPMPFAKSIAAQIVNNSDSEIRISVRANLKLGAVDGLGYLHAFWSQTGPTPGVPHAFADFTTRGHLVGISLHVTATENSWWLLEGDEQFFIDGEAKPSWHGTGLEDYFNGGWYYRGAAFTAVHGIFDRASFQLSQYRFHVFDPVPFAKSMRLQIERGDQNVSKAWFRSTTYAYLDKPLTAPACPTDVAVLRPQENMYYRQNFMLRLIELERMNNFSQCIEEIHLYKENFPDAPENGIYALRELEYRRLLGANVTAADYQPYLDGKFGPEAAEQAKQLVWFYEKPNRHLVALNPNSRARVLLDGKPLLGGDHPYNLFVAGVELTDGPHVLAAEATWTRDGAWVLMGVRSHKGHIGTGPGTKLAKDGGQDWYAPTSAANWQQLHGRLIHRGTPDAPFIGGIPNAYILLQSKAYSVTVDEWGALRGNGYFRVEFTTPLNTPAPYAPAMTGLRE